MQGRVSCDIAVNTVDPTSCIQQLLNSINTTKQREWNEPMETAYNQGGKHSHRLPYVNCFHRRVVWENVERWKMTAKAIQ